MPKKYFCYCIGGTGARVAEAAAHLCAMNMINIGDGDAQEKVEFIIVDKDSECGGTEQATRVIGSISSLSGQNQLDRSEVIPNGQKEFCKNPIEVDTSWDFTRALERLKNQNNNQNQGNVQAGNLGLKAVVTRSRNADDEILMNAFYKKSEQDLDTERGFYGNPSVGSMIFKYMTKTDGNNDIAKPVQAWLSASTQNEARVFIVGSIFGGTGAAIFSNLAAHMRWIQNNTYSKDQNGNREKVDISPQNLRISGVLLLPYFAFVNKDNARVNSAEFYKKSRVALEEYGRNTNLMRTPEKLNGSFDSLYVCGQYDGHFTSESYQDGGEGQKNHFDLVDLIAASSMIDFFNKDFPLDGNGNIVGIGDIYEYRFMAQNSNGAALGQVEITQIDNNLKTKMQQMLLFSAFVVTKMYGQYVLNKQEKSENIYANVTMFNWLFEKKEFNYNYEAIARVSDNLLNSVYSYCREYIRFVYDISKNGNDWSGVGTDYSNGYKLFSSKYVEALKDICSDIDNIETEQLNNDIKNFLESSQDMISNVNPAKTVQSVEDELREIFTTKRTFISSSVYHKKNIAIETKFGDYIHEAYKACI